MKILPRSIPRNLHSCHIVGKLILWYRSRKLIPAEITVYRSIQLKLIKRSRTKQQKTHTYRQLRFPILLKSDTDPCKKQFLRLLQYQKQHLIFTECVSEDINFMSSSTNMFHHDTINFSFTRNVGVQMLVFRLVLFLSIIFLASYSFFMYHELMISVIP